MSISLLNTKLYIPPHRPGIVPRLRLVDKLNTGLHRKLTLVSAPAGFGKTTLVSSWIQQSERPSAWISLDEGDNDPLRFLAYFIAALQTIDRNAGANTQSVLGSPQPPPIEALLAMLINEITATLGQFILILDDYHVIESQEIDKALTFTLANLPPQMHLVIASRTDPTLPLPRLRAQDQIAEVRADDLRFASDEIAAFLKEMIGLNLSAENLAVLETRTEGWIAGLQLAALSMQGLAREEIDGFIANFTSSHRYILDYLTDEVLQQRPIGTQDFLLKTSILDRMSGPLCDAVTGGENGQEILESLETANLFVFPLDNERRWYRYHHLFGDLLCKRMLRKRAAQVQELHRRASRWLEENGLIPEAIDHALAAEDYEGVARLVEGSARQMLEHSQLARLLGLVDALPDEYIRPRPWLCVYHAWALRLSGGQYETVEARLRDVELALEKLAQPKQMQPDGNPTFSEGETHQILGHITAIRAYQSLYREDIPSVIKLAHQALEYRPEGNFVRSSIALALGWAYRFNGDLVAANKALDEARAIGLTSGNIYLAVAATCRAAHGLVLGGKLHQAVESYQDALKMTTTRDGGRLPVAGYAYVYLGGVYREWNDLETAERYLVEGIDLCKQVGYILDQVVGHVNLARVKLAQGDIDSAREMLLSAERLSQMMKAYVYVRRWVEDGQVRLWLALGDLDAATRWAQESGLRADDELNFMRELEHIILARALTALSRQQPGGSHLDEALKLLAGLQKAAETAGWAGKEIEILALQSLALQAQEKNEEALMALERALTLAEPGGYVRTFLDEGEPMAALLRQAASRGIALDYVAKLLAALETETKDEGRRTKESPSVLVEPLSKRELEVLRLMALGLPNREIARQLVIAVTTAKKHVSNIIGKLGVTNRTQAVSRARELGLL